MSINDSKNSYSSFNVFFLYMNLELGILLIFSVSFKFNHIIKLLLELIRSQ